MTDKTADDETPKIDPWGSIDLSEHQKLFEEFGIEEWDDKAFDLEHRLFDRGIVIGHRDFESVYEEIEEGSFINMTGIASSGDLHMGHKVVLDLFTYFQDEGAESYFAVADLDALTTRDHVKSLDDLERSVINNTANAIALGVDADNIYLQSDKTGTYKNLAIQTGDAMTFNEFQSTYGLDEGDTLGKTSAVMLQMADILHPQLEEYSGTMPSITGVSLDQDPHMRMVRDVSRKLPYDLEKPGSVYINQQSGLQEGKKMSSSEPKTAIFLDDTEEEMLEKLKGAKTGGLQSAQEQREQGGRPHQCKLYEAAQYHVEDDGFVEEMYEWCTQGQRLCGECKGVASQKIVDDLSDIRNNYEDAVEQAEQIVQQAYNKR